MNRPNRFTGNRKILVSWRTIEVIPVAIKIDERVIKVSRLNHVIVTQSYFKATKSHRSRPIGFQSRLFSLTKVYNDAHLKNIIIA